MPSPPPPLPLFLLLIVLLAAPPARSVKFGCTAPYSCKTTKNCGQGHREGYLENQVLFQCGHGYLCCPPPALGDTWQTNEKYSAGSVTLPQHRNRYLLPENNCGMTLTNKITAGTDAAVGEFPWMALIGFKGSENQIAYVCGGTLISDRYVLTAAHCLFRENAKLTQVRLGEFDLSKDKDCNGEECFQPAVDIAVEKIIPHENWNNRTYRNDIALLRLNSSTESLHFATIAPICLPFNVSVNLTANLKYETAGWGLTGWRDNSLSTVLQKTNLAAIPLDDCNRAACPTSQAFCPIHHTQVCVQGVRQRDVCKGDSGGPLMTTDTMPTVQLGVTSFKTTEVCGEDDVPSIFTRVDRYLSWILDNLEP